MIVFHEGLPGAGKSYEACVHHILPALKAGRAVVTNIEGVSHDEFARQSGLPVGAVRALLTCLDIRADVDSARSAWLDALTDNCLALMDEAQNLFPCGREKLPESWQVLITEHRHRGIDFVLMGQDRTDIHKLWRGRIQRVCYLTKLEAIGLGSSYKWQIDEKQGSKFVKISSGTRNFEAYRFPLYKSVTGGAVKTDAYADSRALVITPRKVLTFAAVLLGLGTFGVLQLVSFFTPDSPIAQAETSRSTPALADPAPPSPIEVGPQHDVIESDGPTPRRASLDYFDDRARDHRLRLGGFIQSSSDPERFVGFVQVIRGDGNREVERFRIDEVRALGWEVYSEVYGLRLVKLGQEYIARPWSLDVVGRVSSAQANAL